MNNTTIRQVAPAADRFTYYHLDLSVHAVVLAEGPPAEGFVALYGPEPTTVEPADWPRVTVARQLPYRLRAKLMAQAASIAA